MKHYSKQRAAVLQVLQDRYDHPTAAQVYDDVRRVIPRISLGTVYRNLEELYQSGAILRLSTEDGADRYDGHVAPHLHLLCSRCGQLRDLPVERTWLDHVLAGTHFAPGTVDCVIRGTCEACRKEGSDKEIVRRNKS